jgi:hypothetical protein
MNRMIALTTATALVAGSGLALAAPASADGPEKHARGTIGTATYEISAEKDDRRYEVDADLDGVPAGSTWRMVVRHDGEVVAKRTARAARDEGRYDADFRSVRRPDTAGADTFKVTLERVDGTAKVTRTLGF